MQLLACSNYSGHFACSIKICSNYTRTISKIYFYLACVLGYWNDFYNYHEIHLLLKFEFQVGCTVKLIQSPMNVWIDCAIGIPFDDIHACMH